MWALFTDILPSNKTTELSTCIGWLTGMHRIKNEPINQIIRRNKQERERARSLVRRLNSTQNDEQKKDNQVSVNLTLAFLLNIQQQHPLPSNTPCPATPPAQQHTLPSNTPCPATHLAQQHTLPIKPHPHTKWLLLTILTSPSCSTFHSPNPAPIGRVRGWLDTTPSVCTR